MGAVPKKKQTRSRSNKRKNAKTKRFALPNYVRCSSCKKLKEMHVECPHCGFYRTATK